VNQQGSFCWAELGVPDAAGAQQFYTSLFGWRALEIPMDQGAPYTIFQVDNKDVAAMYQLDSKMQESGVPPHWAVYIAVADADDVAKRAVEMGGKVVAGPFDVFDLGRMAVIEDPIGAKFCAWQGRKHQGASYRGPLNYHCWSELATPDPVRAAAFYTELIGWKTKEGDVENAEYVEWLNHGTPIGGMLPMRGDMWKGIPPHWMVYFSVADCDERVEAATKLGAKVCVPPTDIPHTGRFSVLNDPQGAAFSIIQLIPMAA
jgi:predicted enzyme related to lactoylglutathione lyase